MWNRALATVLCTFCRQLPPIEARRPTSATPEATLPEKTQGFAPGSVFTREFARSLPNYLMAGGWHDDVVDMMVCSEFFWLNFLWIKHNGWKRVPRNWMAEDRIWPRFDCSAGSYVLSKWVTRKPWANGAIHCSKPWIPTTNQPGMRRSVKLSHLYVGAVCHRTDQVLSGIKSP